MKTKALDQNTAGLCVFIVARLARLFPKYRGHAEMEFLCASAASINKRITPAQRRAASLARLKPVCNDLADDTSKMVLKTKTQKATA